MGSEVSPNASVFFRLIDELFKIITFDKIKEKSFIETFVGVKRIIQIQDA